MKKARNIVKKAPILAKALTSEDPPKIEKRPDNIADRINAILNGFHLAGKK